MGYGWTKCFQFVLPFHLLSCWCKILSFLWCRFWVAVPFRIKLGLFTSVRVELIPFRSTTLKSWQIHIHACSHLYVFECRSYLLLHSFPIKHTHRIKQAALQLRTWFKFWLLNLGVRLPDVQHSDLLHHPVNGLENCYSFIMAVHLASLYGCECCPGANMPDEMVPMVTLSCSNLAPKRKGIGLLKRLGDALSCHLVK